MLFDNKTYKVILPEGGIKYQVQNVNTNVIEFESESLPRCIIVAQEQDKALDRLYAEAEAEAAKEEFGGTNIVPLR